MLLKKVLTRYMIYKKKVSTEFSHFGRNYYVCPSIIKESLDTIAILIVCL